MAVSDWSQLASTNATADGNNQLAGKARTRPREQQRPRHDGGGKVHAPDPVARIWRVWRHVHTTPAQALANLSNAVVSFFADRANTGAVTLAVSA